MKLKSSIITSAVALGLLLLTGALTSASAQVRGTPTVERFGNRIYEKNGLDSVAAEIRENQRLLQAGRSKELSHSIEEVGRYYWGAPRNAKELKRYQRLASKLGTTPEEMLSQFVRRANRSFLTFDKFLLANVIASNLEATRPDITADLLLSRRGKSFTRTLRDSGLSKEEAEAAEKKARQEIKESKRQKLDTQ
ncbi:MAG TPA: hypothetical protein VF791_22265 [Pyrinomonadaceae bacterium]